MYFHELNMNTMLELLDHVQIVPYKLKQKKPFLSECFIARGKPEPDEIIWYDECMMF